MTDRADRANHEPPYRLKAVIDVGSTAIRMVVAQVHGNGTYKVLDSLSQNVELGRDSFRSGTISPATTEECVTVLRSFRTVLSEYGLDVRRDLRAVATSAAREASNGEEFVDRLYMATGINVEIIEGIEVNRLTFLAVQPFLASYKRLRRHRLLVVEVGGGCTEMLGFESGRVAFAHIYRLGSYRLREVMDDLSRSEIRKAEVLKQEIMTGIVPLQEMAQDNRMRKLLFLGSEIRLAAKQLDPKWSDDKLATLDVKALEAFVTDVLHLDVDKIVTRYHLPFEEAQTLGPALQVCVQMAKSLTADRIHVCSASLRDGLLIESATGNAWTASFVEQVLHSVRELARRYHLDPQHADNVTANALQLFDCLQDEHRLTGRDRLVLRVAAQLHDIGGFINASAHHKHSQYLIQNSDIFGLSKDDTRLVALVARYHRRALPKLSHEEYSVLSRERRLVVRKLAAILRVADALDRSHSPVPLEMTPTLKDRRLVIEIHKVGEVDIEQRAVAEKGKLFEQVYGRSLVVRSRRRD